MIYIDRLTDSWIRREIGRETQRLMDRELYREIRTKSER